MSIYLSVYLSIYTSRTLLPLSTEHGAVDKLSNGQTPAAPLKYFLWLATNIFWAISK